MNYFIFIYLFENIYKELILEMNKMNPIEII